MDYFFFGSLRDPDILAVVLGTAPTHLSTVPATLNDFRAEYAAGYTFPVLAHHPGNSAAGILVKGLTPMDIDRIRYYEDSEYAPERVTVWAEAKAYPASVFVGTAILATSGQPWDYDFWRAREKPLLLAVTAHIFEHHYPRTPQSEMERLWPSLYDEIAARMTPTGSTGLTA